MSRLRTAVQSSLPRVVVFSAIWLGLFVYAGRPLLVAAHAIGIAPAVAWSSLLALSLVPLLPLFVRGAQWIGYAMLALFAMLLLSVAAGDVIRVTSLLARRAIDPLTLSVAAIASAGALSLVGLAQARCPGVRRVSIAIENLPSQLEGYRIVQWSDVHVGPTIRRRFVQTLVDRTNELDADAIVITGDLIDGPLAQLRDEIEPLRELQARDGVFYVTGNHEYYWRADEWTTHLERLGISFLKNDHRIIARDGASLVIAGVTDPVGRDSHKPDPQRALAGAPDAVKVLLSHRPQTAQIASSLGVDLQLSGHTHGGQFFPFNLIIKKFQPIVAGLHRIGRTWLYVNRGTGYWGPPSRLGVRGEITVIELKNSGQ